MTKNILIAEDDEDIVGLLRLYLEKDGYKIGIEHFRADTILNEHTDSESMKYDGQRRAMFKKHNKALQKDEFNADAE